MKAPQCFLENEVEWKEIFFVLEIIWLDNLVVREPPSNHQRCVPKTTRCTCVSPNSYMKKTNDIVCNMTTDFSLLWRYIFIWQHWCPYFPTMALYKVTALFNLDTVNGSTVGFRPLQHKDKLRQGSQLTGVCACVSVCFIENLNCLLRNFSQAYNHDL